VKLESRQVRHVAALARVGEQLSRILQAFESLTLVDTTGVEPATPQVASAALREDVVSGELGVERALANAPEKVGTSFSVPKFLE